MANMRLPLAIFVLRRAVNLALCACLCLNINAALADDSRANKAQLQQLSKEVAQLKKLLSGFQSQRSELENALRQAEINIGQLQTQISKTQQQLNSEQKALQQLQSQRHALQGQKRQQQQQIEQQIRSAFQIGQQKKLKVLLNQEDPEKLSRALAYYDYFNRARAQQVSAYADTIANINKLEPAIQQKTETLKQAKAQLQQEHKALLTNKSTREQSLAKINSSIKSKHQHLTKLNQDRAELERLIEAVEQTIANISIPTDYRPFAQLKGKLPWPLAGKASNSFGSRRSNSELRWQGVNIRANAGSSIKAIHHGRVVFSDWLRGYGLLIIIDHGDDYMSLYGHNQSLLRETGDWVSSGEIIATTGNSGGQQQSGVYFEIRHNGKPSNPALWCKRG